jgi:ubiquinone/menaquinone biosynthesis C-methylase UbiE
MMDYFENNKASWNKWTTVNFESDFYDVPSFLQGKNVLNSIELDFLGDVNGKSILHLQCHFGMDTLSLARMGAQVTGVDLSDEAIKKANQLNEQLELSAQFINCNVYDLPQHLDQQFDIVFTSYGTIGWLPDIQKWASVVSHFLKPGGAFVFAEFHPVVWMMDDDFEKISYRYFNDEAIVETNNGSYADRNADVKVEFAGWNHGLAEVQQALMDQEIRIEKIKEFDYSPYNCFNGTVESEPGKFRIEKLGNKIPMVYSLLGRKLKTLS